MYRAASGKVYLIVCAKGLGDVYELSGGDSITVATNKQTAFYGDTITFTGNSTSANVSNVAWNFGNTEAGTRNSATSGVGQPVPYQYSNLTRNGLGSKSVIASSLTPIPMSAARRRSRCRCRPRASRSSERVRHAAPLLGS